MSKPNPKDPKPIPPLFDEVTQPTWWKHREYSEDEINSIFNLFQTQQKNLVFTTDLYENLKYLYKTLGLHAHPCLNPKKPASPDLFDQLDPFNIPDRIEPIPVKEPPKEEKKTLARKDTKQSPTKKDAKPVVEEEAKPEPPIPPFIVKDMKVDLVLVKLLGYCWGKSKTTCLKLIKNQLEDHIEDAIVQVIANPTFVLNQFFFELNPPINMERFVTILNNPNLEFLSLRTDAITDNQLGVICESLKTNTTLRFLELFDNSIKEGIKHFVPLLRVETCNLQYVGLARNGLSEWRVIEEWFDGIGRFPMTLEDVEKYREKEREKEAAIQKNLKNKSKKGYVNEPIEYMDPIVQKEDESWIMVKGGKLKIISLAFNKFDDSCAEKFDKFLERQADDFCLILTGNPMTKVTIENLVNTHKNKVVFD